MMRRARSDGWKALPLLVVAIGALVWHLLACMESPMSFSPGGDLAFTTMEPYRSEDVVLRGAHVYRLMVLPAKATQPKVLEESADWMISAPVFSPDGKRIAYLRIPLLTAEELARIGPVVSTWMKAATQPASTPVPVAWPTMAALGQPSTAPANPSKDKVEEVVLPPWELTRDYPALAFDHARDTGPARGARHRNRTYVSLTAVSLPLPTARCEDKPRLVDGTLKCLYILTRLNTAPTANGFILAWAPR